MKLRRHVSLLAAVALLITAIAANFPLTAGVAQTPAADADPFTVALRLEDIRFEPPTLQIPADQDVIVRVENTGAALHDFVVPELNIAVEVAPGESTEVTINAPAGRYSIICSVSGHKEAGMVGTLLVIAGPAVDPTASPSPVVVEDATALPASPAADEWNPAGLSAHDLLPELQDFDGQWTVEQEGERSETEVAEALGPEGEELLRTWGWQENSYRDFARENPEQFPDEATFVNVSIHGFADAEGAATALQVLSQQVVDVQHLEELPVDDLGENARALSGPGDGVNLTVVYVQAGNFLIRVGASSELGDPAGMAIDVAEVILAKGESASQISPVATGSPLASPAAVLDDPGCEGLPGYSRQVLAIETDSWNKLIAEFGIDEEDDLYFLEEEQYADLAMILDSKAAMLMQVEAPEFAEDWHQNLIATAQLAATTARMVPQAGNPFAAIVQLWDVSEVLDEQNRQAYLDALSACPAFATFWSELSLIGGDAETPPDATSDYSSCAGLQPYDSNYRRAHVQAFANRPDLAGEFFEFSEESEDDLRARTPTELLMLAAAFMEIRGEIAQVTAPDYASEWHFSQIMYYETAADFLKAAAADGFESAETEFGEQFGIVGILADAAAEKATDECAVFYEFATS